MSEEEKVWECEGCLKQFSTGLETQAHELTCVAYTNLYPDKQTELQKNSSRVKYSGLSIFITFLQALAILYFIIGILLIVFLYREENYTLMEIFSASFLFTPAIIFYAMSELIKLLMDLQDNTYQSTELNLVMAESLKSIEENIKSIAEEIKKE